MTRRGRPLRFLALVMTGWVGARILLLLPQAGSLPAAIRMLVPMPAGPAVAGPAPPRQIATMPASPAAKVPAGRTVPAIRYRQTDSRRVQMALLNLMQFGGAEAVEADATAWVPPGARPVAPPHLAPMDRRWSASGWLVARPGSGLSAAPGESQLGGSQAGIRIAWVADPKRRIALYGRATAPLAVRGGEVALGIEWQPTRAPVRLAAERRFGLDGSPGGTGIGTVAGIDSAPLPAGFRLESYGQAGVVLRGRGDPYADGAARATRPLLDRRGVKLALGAGIWGAAQRDAERFDVGPSATLSLPAGQRNLRIAVDWRQRVAGHARPGSGIAVTLGSDF